MLPTAHPIRVLLVDTQELFRVAVRLLIESWGTMKVVGDTGNQAEALSLAERENPHIILVEIDFKGDVNGGLAFLPKLLSLSKSRVIVMTHLQDVELHHRAIHYGARGLVLKDHSPEQLRNAILRVNDGEAWLDNKLTTSIITKMAQANRLTRDGKESVGIASLSPRESELARLVGNGWSNREVAGRLYISETTVRHHLTSIFRKLHLTNRLELIIYLLRPGTTKPPAGRISQRTSHSGNDISVKTISERQGDKLFRDLGGKRKHTPS
jgi:two-component system nitrate/nitrite response regulator NarL